LATGPEEAQNVGFERKHSLQAQVFAFLAACNQYCDEQSFPKQAGPYLFVARCAAASCAKSRCTPAFAHSVQAPAAAAWQRRRAVNIASARVAVSST
jgi:hypothetical protein